MTKQELFNTVVTHLFTQGKRAVVDGRCRYKYEDTKCAVGCLIPDEMYSGRMENKGFTSLLIHAETEEYSLPEVITNPKHRAILKNLQVVHDNGDNWISETKLRTELAKVAKKCKVDPSILEGLHFEQTDT